MFLFTFKSFAPALFLAVLMMACSKSTESFNQERDKNQLNQLYKEIRQEIDAFVCKDSEEWSFTPLGQRACGGPQQYVPYPLSEKGEELLSRITAYTQKEKEYNIKYKIVSTCIAELSPDTVECKEGKPRLMYKDIN